MYVETSAFLQETTHLHYVYFSLLTLQPMIVMALASCYLPLFLPPQARGIAA